MFPMITVETDRDEFVDALAEWCSKWVSEVAIPIMVCADELYENKAVVHLVMEWKHSNDNYNECRRRFFTELADIERTNTLLGNRETPTMFGEFYDSDASAYSNALYRLLVRS